MPHTYKTPLTEIGLRKERAGVKSRPLWIEVQQQVSPVLEVSIFWGGSIIRPPPVIHTTDLRGGVRISRGGQLYYV